MKKVFYLTLAAVVLISFAMISAAGANHWHKGDDWVYKGVTIEQVPAGVKHYVWELDRPPYGPFDKIALHRFVYEPHNQLGLPGLPARDKRKVLFIIPGTWDKGSPKGTDPNFSENHFFAVNGYDTYSIDFRTNYIANLAYDQFQSQGYEDALQDTGDWTYGVFREDIKACVDKAKQLSRAKKLFMAGRSRGGTQLFIYASKYWKQDLKGLISLDGGGKVLPPSGTALTEEDYQARVEAFKANEQLLSEVGSFELGRFAGAVPFSRTSVGGPLPDTSALIPPIPEFAPPDKSEIITVSDLVAYGSYWTWGAGGVTNYYMPYPGGSGETYMSLEALIDIESNFTRYWPAIQDVEGAQLRAYSGGDCPFLDYDDHLADLPLIAFLSDLFCPGGACLALPGNMTLSDDATMNYLPGYGHLDVYAGTHSLEDVKQPMLEWMNARK